MANFCYTAVGNENVARLCVTKEDISCQKIQKAKVTERNEPNLIVSPLYLVSFAMPETTSWSSTAELNRRSNTPSVLRKGAGDW